jgi:hypothetical protein
MKREQLTNVETEAQCQELADRACEDSRTWIYWMRLAKQCEREDEDATPEYGEAWHVEECIIAAANRIIALRSQQVTP